VVNLLAVLERVKVNQDAVAKIVINERTGTIVAGGDIRLNPVAISHGDLIIQVGEGKKGATQALHMIDKKGTLNELVNALNALGTGPEDLISIFQTLKKNGALVAELEFI
jgi:flagellar P-ring protein precursor FlgI